MLIFYYIIKYIITNKSKILKNVYVLFVPYMKVKKLPNLFPNPYRKLYLSFEKI
jgi:hypothetical protein